MKAFLLLIFFVFFITVSFAQTKTWIGPNLGNWSTAGNWSPAVLPTLTDTVIFNTTRECNVDVNATIASFRVTAGATANLYSTANRLITINNNGAAKPVLHVAAGGTLILGGSSGTAAVSVSTWGAGTTNNSQILGNLFFNLASTWTTSNGVGNTTNIDVSGIVTVTANSTPASLFITSAAVNLRFLSGSNLFWGRNGGSVPVADYKDGSGIFVSAITSTMLTFTNGSIYNGLITWDCPSQTISGSAAVLLPSASASMDSIHIISTGGSGSLRLFTEPQGYTLGHVEVQGGTLELSSPVTGYRVGTITGNLKITGGNVIGNATFTGDVFPGAAHPMTLTVNGNFIMTAGTFNLTNRPISLTPGGAFQIHVNGNVAQGAGLVTTTSGFGSQNYIMLNGTVSQNLELTNFTGPASLIINNAAGALLQNDLYISFVLSFISGVLTSSTTNLLTFGTFALTFGATNASFVDGPVSKIGSAAFDFPVGKTTCGPSGTKKGYAPIGISNFTGGTLTDQYTAEYIRGNGSLLGPITTGADHISACDYWTLTRDGATSSTVDITLNWKDSINNCTYASPYIDNVPSLAVAHFNNVSWNAIGTIGINSGGSASGSVTWGLPQSNGFGIFAIASTDLFNPLPITINYFNGIKNNGNHLLNWKLTCVSTASATVEIERSSNGVNYNSVYSIFATALRCQQPFSFTDAQPAKGINYYRIKTTSAEGKILYSSIVSLINDTKGIEVMNIAPNPVVNGNFNLKISAAEKTAMEIVITDMQGRVVQKQSANLIAGFNNIPMHVRNLAAGTYQLFGNSSDGRTRVLRFVVQ